MSDALAFRNPGLAAGQPALHALIVGVSAYRFLAKGTEPSAPEHYGMRQLTASSLSGYRLYQWLLDRGDHLPAPLGSVRLLLSPSTAEVRRERGLRRLGSPATLDNFLDTVRGWRKDALLSRDNVTLFYFAGHGVQRMRGDHVMLLEGFGDSNRAPLYHAVDTGNLFDGMAPSKDQPDIARTQFYFVDACRITPEEFLKRDWMDATQIWVPLTRGQDDRATPVFYTAVPGASAYALPGDQTIFSKALIDCLKGGAGVRLSEDGEAWGVTVNSLNEVLQQYMDRVTAGTGARQEFRVNGIGPKIILHSLDQAPPVEVIVEVDPTAARACAGLQIVDDMDETVLDVPPPLGPQPIRHELRAGSYRFSARIQPPTQPYIDRKTKFLAIRPPQFRLPLRVAPQ